MAAEITRKLIFEHFTDADIKRLGSGVGPDARPLPAKGYAAMRRLGWTATSDVHCSDRVHRMGEEAAARLLRQADHRRQIVAGIIATWPKDPKRRTQQEWESLERVLPEGATTAEVRNRSRQVAAFWSAQGHLPQGLEELEEQPQVFPQLLLAACDRQAVTLTRTTGSFATLRVQLPKSSKPRSRQDWSWVSIPVRLPPTVPESAQLHTPTLRVKAGRTLVDLPFTMDAPAIPRSGHQVGIGLDWGINTFLVGALAEVAQGVLELAANGSGDAGVDLAAQGRLEGGQILHIDDRGARTDRLVCSPASGRPGDPMSQPALAGQEGPVVSAQEGEPGIQGMWSPLAAQPLQVGDLPAQELTLPAQAMPLGDGAPGVEAQGESVGQDPGSALVNHLGERSHQEGVDPPVEPDPDLMPH